MRFKLDIESIKYIKIIYKDFDGFTHWSKASLKRIDEREIFACAKFDDGLKIKTPQDVELNIASENGMYKANSQLKYVENEPPYVFFTIKTPDDMNFQQNREYFRVKLNDNAMISYNDVNISCKICDISANGVRLIIDNQFDFPENAILTIYFPEKTITTNAKFIRTDDEDNILKASFCFENLKETDLDYISQICLKEQLEQRRKNFM